MERHIPDRQEALELLQKYNESESLINHAKAVEAVMIHAAGQYDEDKEKWGIVGLIHDIDYEKYPEEHCHKAKEILDAAGWDEEYIRAMMSHGWGIVTDVEPLSMMEKTLYAVDELTGLISACALVRPSKSVKDMNVKSVKKKWKQKSFAAGANRDIISKGAEMLGMELSDLINMALEGMKLRAEEIGL